MEPWKELFPYNEEIFEEYELSRLHKAVLDVDYQGLQAQLATQQIDVNLVDSLGRSALFWATLKNDVRAVEMLLEANADPNVCDHFGEPPILQALYSTSMACVKLLLGAKASFNITNRSGQNWMHKAAITSEIERGAVEFMLAVGVDPTVRNQYGSTPLAHTTRWDNSAMATALLNAGADIDSQDNDGDSPLHEALFSHADRTTSLLLRWGARYDRPDSKGDPIIHIAAAYGGIQTLEILLAAKIKGVDPDGLNRQGKTALLIAQNRTDKPSGFVEKLEELLADIRVRNTAYEHDGHKDAAESLGIRPFDLAKQALKLSLGFLSGSIWVEPFLWIWLDQANESTHWRLQYCQFDATLKAQRARLQQSKWLSVGLAWTIGILCGLLLGLLLPSKLKSSE